MSTFKSAYQCKSLEEFVQEHYRIKFNEGKRGITIADLKWVADQHEIKYKSSLRRDELFDLLEENHITPMDLYSYFPNAIGVTNYDYRQRFNVNTNEFQKLKRRNFLEIIGRDRVRMYGSSVYYPIYSAEQFFNMTREKIDEALATKTPRKKPVA